MTTEDDHQDPDLDLEHLELENPDAVDDFNRRRMTDVGSAAPSEPDAPRPFSAPVTDRLRQYRFVFAGSAGEYFRIWIVNLCLTVLTLGIYAAWAKVRTRRYFYAHTLLAGQPFDYLANPWYLLKGNIIIGAGVLLYTAAERFAPLLGIAVAIPFYLFLPFLIYKSLRFHAHNSSYRNIRFRFRGTLKECYRIYLVVPLLLPLTLGLIFPYWVYRRKRFFFKNFSFGQSVNTFTGRASVFYRIYTQAGLILSVPIAIILLYILGSGSGLPLLTGKAGYPLAFPVVLPILGLLAMLVAVTFAQQYLAARVGNYSWNQTKTEDLAFESTISAGRLLWIRTTNILAIFISLGLLFPWAKVRRTRYLIEHLVVTTEHSFDRFTAAQAGEESAIGEAATDFFDIGLGW